MTQEKYNGMLYANQICIKPINNRIIGDDFQVLQEETYKAGRTLTHSGFMIYMFLCTLENKTTSFTYNFLKQFIPISSSSYHRAMTELKKYGYLTFHDEYAMSENGIMAQIWQFSQTSIL